MARRTKTESLHVPQRTTIALDPDRWPRSYQRALLAAMLDPHPKHDRFLAVWHRGAGKDFVAFFATVILMLRRPGNYYHVFPKLVQGRTALWDGITEQGTRFLDLIPPELMDGKPNETELMIRLKPANGHSTGSTWQILGTDELDRHRGVNPTGVVFSEYRDMPARTFEEVFEPRLLTNRGWALWATTPRGKNHLWKLWQAARAEGGRWFTQLLTVDDTRKDAPGESGDPVVPPEQIKALRDRAVDEAVIQQEYFCSFEGRLTGSVFGDGISAARKEGRIGAFPYRPELKVHTAWDIGRSDGTAIWFYQTDGYRFSFIDFLFERGHGLPYYIHFLKERKPYVYGDHLGPHDLEIVEYTEARGRMRKEVARDLGVDFRIAPKVAVEEGHDAGRRILSRCYFHETTCGSGIDHLGSYHYAWDDRKQEFGKEPVHDEHSHAADAFRYFALAPCEHNEGRDYRPPARHATSRWDPHSGALTRGR